MKRIIFVKSVIICVILFGSINCTGNKSDYFMEPLQVKNCTRTIPSEDFDWEIADTMPTPKGQSRIYMPWDGPGSLVTTYGDDVLYDYKKKDGWTLFYNTFTSKASSVLNDPLFILYNKYNGLLRVYQYITTPFVHTATSIEGGIRITDNNSSILNFMGNDIINGAHRRRTYKQILPAPFDGGKPLAANKWYMMEFEMAYDPTIYNKNNLKMAIDLNFYDVTSFKFSGNAKGYINGTIGLQSEAQNIGEDFKNVGKSAGTAVLSSIGKSFLEHHSQGNNGENDLGLNKKVFSLISSGVSGALKNAAGGLPGAAIGLLSGIIGGAKSSTQAVNLTFNVGQINLEGIGTSSGSLPSMPTGIRIPGTANFSTAPGIMPLYSEPLGIFNFIGKPDINLKVYTYKRYRYDDPYNPGAQITETWSTLSVPQTQFDSYIVVNPSVLQFADVDIKYDLIADNDGHIEINPNSYSVYDSGEHDAHHDVLPHPSFYIQITAKVTPKNGDADYTIYKSFDLNNVWSETVKWLADYNGTNRSKRLFKEIKNLENE